MKKITILGGGLAGLSLGMSLQKHGIQTKILDAGKYPRHRVCGEFIAGVSETVLADLGIDTFLADAKRHSSMEWWMGNDCVLQESTPTHAYGISRYLLDQRLADAFVSLGGDLETEQHVEIQEIQDEGWILATGKLKKKVINKSGRKSGKRWIGLKIHALGIEAEACARGLVMHSSLNSCANGYLGLCPVEDNRMNCCGLFELQNDITPSFAKARWGKHASDMKVALMMSYAESCGMNALLEWLHDHTFDSNSFTAIAGFQLGDQQRLRENLFCVGDAAHLIPPFTGNGMSMALESCAIASQKLQKYARGESGWSTTVGDYRAECKKHFSKRTTLAKVIHPLFFNRIGQSTLKAIARSGFPSFDSLFTLLRTP